jgi:hypothetical protein
MRRAFFATVVSIGFLLNVGPSFAQKGGGPKPKPAGAMHASGAKSHSTGPTMHGSSTKPTGGTKLPSSSPHSGPNGPKATSPTTTRTSPTQKTTTPSSNKGPSTNSAKSGASGSTKPGKSEKLGSTPTSAASSPSNSPSTSTVGSAATLTPLQQKLQTNTTLASKLQSRLPGTNLMQAADGFKNLGQFVAAVNVSNNLGIPFADLKTKMVTDGKSLGQSIQALRPEVSATVEAQRAEYDARGMIAESEVSQTVSGSTTTTTTTKTAKPKKQDSGGTRD